MRHNFFQRANLFVVAITVFISLLSLAIDDIPSTHERAMDKMLRTYQKDLNLLIPILVKEPSNKKGKEFLELYFIDDSIVVANHVMPGKVKTDKNIEDLAIRNTLKPSELLFLISGTYKQSFKFNLDRDEVEYTRLSSTALLSQYKVTLPLYLNGHVNNEVSVELRDTLTFITEVFTDSKQNISSVKIKSILHKGNPFFHPEPYPQKVEPVLTRNDSIIDWSPEKKIQTFLGFIKMVKEGKIEQNTLDQIDSTNEILFDASGFVSVITKEGTLLQLSKDSFLKRVAEKKTNYELINTSISLYDQFRKNEYGRWFCRITTYHDVERFESGEIVAGKITSVLRMPTKQNSISLKGLYYQLSELKLKEL
jgi:hypothetical protein